MSRKNVKANEKVSCRSLRSYRAERPPFRVAGQVCVGPISGTIGPVTSAQSSYDPGIVLGAAKMPTSDRKISSFVTLAKCIPRLEAHELTLEQAAAVIRLPNSSSKAHVHLQDRGVQEEEIVSLPHK